MLGLDCGRFEGIGKNLRHKREQRSQASWQRGPQVLEWTGDITVFSREVEGTVTKGAQDEVARANS